MNKSIAIEDIREKYKNRQPGYVSQRRFFAVLLPVIEVEGALHLLYEVRARNLDAQPGEICFPGGRQEEEEDFLTCALRETQEEIGIPAEKIEIIGEGDTFVSAPEYLIKTYVGLLKCGEEDISINEEVEEVFTVPLSYFLDNQPDYYQVTLDPVIPADFPYDAIEQNPDYKWHQGRYGVYIYHIPGRSLWGITAKLTKHFVDDLTGKAGPTK